MFRSRQSLSRRRGPAFARPRIGCVRPRQRHPRHYRNVPRRCLPTGQRHPWRLTMWTAKDNALYKDGNFIGKVETAERAEAAVKRINLADAAPDLLAACEAQHTAIDTLFAMLARANPEFFPSQSGQPWEAIQQGNV